jgi:hypothetical protein
MNMKYQERVARSYTIYNIYPRGRKLFYTYNANNMHFMENLVFISQITECYIPNNEIRNLTDVETLYSSRSL